MKNRTVKLSKGYQQPAQTLKFSISANTHRWLTGYFSSFLGTTTSTVKIRVKSKVPADPGLDTYL